MLHFRTPSVESDLPPELNIAAGEFASFGPMAESVFSNAGLAQASIISTARGPVLARDLRIGDQVMTRDSGLQPVRWVGSSTVMYEEGNASEVDLPCFGPVRIRAGAFGTDPDAGNLVLAPGQRLLVRNWRNELLFATEEVMAPVGDLTHLEGVDFVSRNVGRWQHILLSCHEMILVNGIWMESFAPDMWSISVSYPEAWQSITDAVPRLRYDATRADFVESRMTIDEREARFLDSF